MCVCVCRGERLFAVTKIPPKAPFQSQLSRIELPVKPDAGQHPFTC